MKFTLESDRSVNLVRAYAPGRIKVGGREYASSVILTPERIIPDWTPAVIADLTAAHLDEVLAVEPDIVLLGTGARLRFPAPELLAGVLGRGIGIECMDTRAACRTYNVLVHEGRRVAAALLISSEG
ncbi:MAG TPA: Mth938-like domain-containing protein [Gammaproteobacteria bacterium]|nr:Mth938-like domain-containing protein [Gammaproteobacteria bacterium]